MIRAILAGLAMLILAVVAVPIRAEVVEEIVAEVNGDIITRSDLEDEEQALIAEAYRRFTGAELDARVNEVKQGLLIGIIDRKILTHYAQQRFNVKMMRDSFYEGFKTQQGIEDDEEMARLLAQEGLTVDDMKDRLVEMLAPDEVIRFEVSGRVSVGDKEVETFYSENPADFTVPGEVTLSEIVLLADSPAKKDERRSQALQIHQRALTEDFAALAREVSEAGTKDDGGLLGNFQRGELSPKLDEVAFRLDAGQVSQLLELPHGFHIVRVDARTEDTIKPLEEVVEPLRRALEQRRIFDDLEVFLTKVRGQADWCVRPAYRDRLEPSRQASVCSDI